MSCPICGKPVVADSRPFCSKRCADVDLARWFNGAYTVPSQEVDDTEELDRALQDAANAAKAGKPH